MLMTIAIVLVALWLLGIITSYTIGGFIHILIVIAVIVNSCAGYTRQKDTLEVCKYANFNFPTLVSGNGKTVLYNNWVSIQLM